MDKQSINLDKLSYAYVLVHSLCATGQDYLDCFWPFAAHILYSDSDIDLKRIRYSIETEYSLTIPHYTLMSVLTRATKEGYLNQKRKLYSLSQKGIEYINKLESEQDVQRRLNELIDDISQFLIDSTGQKRNRHSIQSALYDLIEKNLSSLSEFFNSGKKESAPPITDHITDFQKSISRYFELANDRKPSCYKTLSDIYFGSLVSKVINSEKASDISQINYSKLVNCIIYLDTNVIFSILKLHDRESNASANELLQILLQQGFQIKVFNFTVDEICSVLQRYISAMHRYPEDIEINSIYSTLKKNKWTKFHIRDFISNIEEILMGHHIVMDLNPQIDLGQYEPRNNQERNRLAQYKISQDRFNQNHDLAAIDKIIEYRSQPIRKIENAKAIFLSSDRHLSRYNFEAMGHKDKGTICEVITTNLLTNIIWLKNPTSDISLQSLISVYSSNLLINNKVWEQFYELLRKLRLENKITDPNIEALFYHHYIEDTLTGIDEVEVGRIDEEFIHKNIKKALEKSGKILEQKEQEFIQQIRKAVNTAEINKEGEWLHRIQQVKTRLRFLSGRSAARWANLFASIVTIIILGLCYFLNILAQNVLSSGIYWIFIIVLGGGSIFTIWKKSKKWLGDKLTNRFYYKRLKEIELDNIDSQLIEDKE